MINLQDFCLEKTATNRPQLMSPFARGQWVYATDGRIMIRVPNEGDAALSEAFNHPLAPTALVLEAFKFELTDDAPRGWKELPKLPKRLSAIKCGECKGARTVDCEMGYTHPCGACDGEGTVEPQAIPVDLGYVKASDRYLGLIATLPNPVIAATGSATDAIPFRFDGGCGLLMPMRVA